MNYVPVQVKTHYSLLQSTIRPEDLAEYAESNKINALCITDYTLGSAVNAFKVFKDKPTKLIMGNTICLQEKDSSGYITLLSKNLNGWKTLVKLTSFANNPVKWNGAANINTDDLSKFDCKDLICITGGLGSIAANSIIKEKSISYNEAEYGNIKGGLYDDWKDKTQYIFSLQNIFKEDFYLESSIQDYIKRPIQRILTEYWRSLGIKIVASPDAHYIRPDDCYDQRVLLCSRGNFNFTNLNDRIGTYDNNTYGRFFVSDKYDLPIELKFHRPEELKNTFEIAEKCEKYNILSSPKLPHIDCPNGMDENEYLRELCRQGWRDRLANKVKKEEYQLYGDRMNYELSVIKEKGFSSYFLILADILNWVRSQDQLVGPARGSAGGCLVSYLSRITSVNPLKHGLLFERFMNPGRKSMPDIDVDVSSAFRQEVIKYIKGKYGEDNVAQLLSYQNIKGRSALKIVLNAYGNIPFSVMNDITKSIPDEAKISDDLQEMEEEDGESSIIRWALENNSKQLASWCELKDGKFEGPFAPKFEQAIRLEGIKHSQSKHPSGIVVAPGRFDEFCPLIYDSKKNQLIAGFDMRDIEELGLVKLDILATRVLDKLQAVCRSL